MEIENNNNKKELEHKRQMKIEMEKESEHRKQMEMEKNKKKSEHKKSMEMEMEKESEHKKQMEVEKEKERRMKRHRKGRSMDPYIHDKLVKYKNDDSLDIIFNPDYYKSSSVFYKSHSKLSSSFKLEFNNTVKTKSKLHTNNSVVIIHPEIPTIHERTSKDNDSYSEIMKKINNNKRVYSKTKKNLIPKDDNSSSIVIDILSINNEIYTPHHRKNHRRYYTEPTKINSSIKSTPAAATITTTTTTTTTTPTTNTNKKNVYIDDLTIVINQNDGRSITHDKERKKYETVKKDQKIAKHSHKIYPVENLKLNNDDTILDIENVESPINNIMKSNTTKNKVSIRIKDDDEEEEIEKYNSNEMNRKVIFNKNEALIHIRNDDKLDNKTLSNDPTKYTNIKDDKINNSGDDKMDKNHKENKNEEIIISTIDPSDKTLIMKTSSSDSLAYHQFEEFNFDPIVSQKIININNEIESNRKVPFFQFYWGLKLRFIIIILMNLTQQFIQFIIFISYFNLLGDQILNNYFHIFYLYTTEFLLFIPVNVYLCSRNRKVVLYGGLVILVATFCVLTFSVIKLKNFYVYFTLVLVILFNSSWSIIPVIYQAEIFPTHARVAGSSVGCLVSQCCHLILFLCIPYIYKGRLIIYGIVIFFIIIFSILGAFILKDTSNVELEKIDNVFKQALDSKKIKKKLNKLYRIKNIDPIKKVSFAIVKRGK
ncbi:hypothetical protein BCR36DRAFT_411226 [Piromyces finnis]|uniref:Major facilitator superfamily (MFS) profile domain-containing protein n=1 Tax=Piromyces finnis TaxID=1754191 RepID=A0A1Y1VDS0_9FUNG|nr:hypothetical protein BCR36DRAFT_411226 [Piromyces finnis]|eukprot:ORX53453.1 hypothetical protein BCR36DRAFT_411226 [Piromyces finnis]